MLLKIFSGYRNGRGGKMGDYETKYEEYGEQLSYVIKLRIEGIPISGRTTDTDSCPKLLKNVAEWKKSIRDEVEQRCDNEYFPLAHDNAKFKNCNLYATFWLLNKDSKEKGHNPYRDRDLDNLLKPVLDALQEAQLIKNDKYFKCIRAQKEPVSEKEHQGIEIECVTTKTFKIEEVEQVEGKYFMPDYWNYPMQYITATDINSETNNRYTFIDNMPGLIFIADKEKYSSAVPGYDWKEKKGTTMEISGCMVFKRYHQNPNKKECPKPFYWLQKWAW